MRIYEQHSGVYLVSLCQRDATDPFILCAVSSDLLKKE